MSVDGFSLLGFYVVYMLMYVWVYMYIWGGVPACMHVYIGQRVILVIAPLV